LRLAIDLELSHAGEPDPVGRRRGEDTIALVIAVLIEA
jgi:hypothetical protein